MMQMEVKTKNRAGPVNIQTVRAGILMRLLIKWR